MIDKIESRTNFRIFSTVFIIRNITQSSFILIHCNLILCRSYAISIIMAGNLLINMIYYQLIFQLLNTLEKFILFPKIQFKRFVLVWCFLNQQFFVYDWFDRNGNIIKILNVIFYSLFTSICLSICRKDQDFPNHLQ